MGGVPWAALVAFGDDALPTATSFQPFGLGGGVAGTGVGSGLMGSGLMGWVDGLVVISARRSLARVSRSFSACVSVMSSRDVPGSLFKNIQSNRCIGIWSVNRLPRTQNKVESSFKK